MKKPLIILTGPTAVGKTSLSIGLAKRIGGEIISADSMQVYRQMNVGTAKITTAEMESVPHHLIDILDPSEEFNVVQFKKRALEAMEGIYNRGKIPIVVGGTGFYIQALLYDIQFEDNDSDKTYRTHLEQIGNEQGHEVLHQMLCQVDPVSGEKIHPNNTKRVIRALEFYNETGMPISEHNKAESQRKSPYQFLYIVLNTDRSILYQRINQRVDNMIEEGLIEEVRNLLQAGYTSDLVSMQGLGYKEIVPYLENQYLLEEAVDILKKETRHFAKRQITWFKREKSVDWIEKEAYQNEEDILNELASRLNERGIL